MGVRVPLSPQLIAALPVFLIQFRRLNQVYRLLAHRLLSEDFLLNPFKEHLCFPIIVINE
jgi:hypothetical protein